MYVNTLYSEESSFYQKSLNYCAGLALEVALSSGVGYLVSWTFSIVNPLHGAVFCVISTLVSKVTLPIFDLIFNNKGANNAVKVMSNVVSIVVSTSIATGVATLIGFPISFASGLILSTIIITAYLITTLSLLLLGITINALQR